MANDFKKALKDVDLAIKRGTTSALNKALAQTKTKVIRQLREDTGLKTDVITTRTRFKKAKSSDLSVIMGLAIKFGFPLRYFAPLAKKVKKGTRSFLGATVKIGSRGRELVPGAFILKVRSTSILAGRKLAFTGLGKGLGSYSNSSAPSYPTVELKTDAFAESSKALEQPSKQFLKNTFERIVAHEIDYAVQKQLNSNK